MLQRIRRRRSDQRGAAVADFVLVMIVLLPMFLGVLQVALVIHVRNTMTSAASEGARYAARYDSSIPAGEQVTREHISSALSGYCANPDCATGRPIELNGQPAVEMTVSARVPLLGVIGPNVSLTVHGTAVKESAP